MARSRFSNSRLLPCLLTVLALSACGGRDDTGNGISPGKSAPSTGFGTRPSLSVSNKAFVGDHFSGSASCNVCHNDLYDDQNNDVSIGTAWETSTMANSSRDPYWRAKLAATLKNHPGLTAEINDTCTRCHAPMANEAIRKLGNGSEMVALGAQGMLNPQSLFFDHAMDGVSCSACHQIADTGTLGTPESGSGNFVIDSYDVWEERPAYGQYADPVGGYMVANARFNPVYSAHISESGMCATCHDLYTHKLDEDGDVIAANLTDRFPEQQTFSEWNNSDYRTGGNRQASCQDCHMPGIETTVNLASSGTDLRRDNFSQHSFLGANTVMLSMFDQFRDELGITVTGFEQAILRNREFLRDSATIEFSGISHTTEGMVASLVVENLSGHKLPSGYPSRRVVVHLLVTDDDGNIVFESGKINPDGSIDGADGDPDYRRYETHYQQISGENQVQIYEAIMADRNGDVTHSLVEAHSYLKDNRLAPAGFDKNIVPSNVAVVGRAKTDSDFNNGLDYLSYHIPLPASGNYNLLVELVYQPLAFGHLEYLFRDTDLPDVDAFKTIYDATDLKSEVISSSFSTHTHP